MTRTTPFLLGLLVAGGLVLGCGSSSPASPPTTAGSATPSEGATASAAPTPTASASPTASPTPSGATLVISEYGVALTLSSEVADATYRIDDTMATGPTPGTDADGNTFTELPGVRIWTASLAADPACSDVTDDGLVAIAVFPSDPSSLDLPEGPTDYRHVGQYWFGISHENGYGCSDGNMQEVPSVNALMQAFDTIHAA